MQEYKLNSRPLFLNGTAATPARPTNDKFWQFRNAADTGGTAELLLYGNISQQKSWYGDEVTPKEFAADLAEIPATEDLTVRICSGGGDVWAAQAIGSLLENRIGTVTAQIEGICASAATIIASHCKVVKAAEDATYMIHPIRVNPNGYVDMEGLQELMDALTVMRTNVLNQYAKKTGHTVDEVAEWMDATSWWSATEAKEHGFVDEITTGNQTASIENRNGALFVNSVAVEGGFDNAPEFVRNRAVVAPATEDGFVNTDNNTNPAEKPDNDNGGTEMEFKNKEELRAGCPDLVNEIVNDARAEAQQQERDRLAAIDEIADTIPSEMVAEAKYGAKACTAQELAYRAAVDAKQKGHKFLDDVQNDAQTSGANAVGGATASGVAGTGMTSTKPTDAEKRAAFKKLLHHKKED